MQIDDFEKKINYKFKNKSLIQLAFTHSSFNKKKKQNFSYERLEFLGDRVLSLVIAHILFSTFSQEDEGALSKRLSDLSNASNVFANDDARFLVAIIILKSIL